MERITGALLDIAVRGCNAAVGESVIVPEGVTAIAAGAFARQKALREVALPSTLVSIGEEAFIGCSSLVRVVLPEGLLELGARYE